MIIYHLAERTLYAEEELAWLQAGAPMDKCPWRGWEYCYEGTWLPCISTPMWYDKTTYRKKLRVIIINGREVPEPLRKLPEAGTKVFCVALEWGDGYWHDNFLSWSVTFNRALKLGLMHLTADAAKLHAEALLSFTKE